MTSLQCSSEGSANSCFQAPIDRVTRPDAYSRLRQISLRLMSWLTR